MGAPGVKWNMTEKSHLPEYCRVETIFRLTGGFNLVTSNLVAGSKVPVLAPIYIDKATRKATVIRNVRVIEAVAAGSTTIKIAKGSLAAVGLLLGTGASGAVVSGIDKSSSSHDELTVEAAFGEVLELGAVLFEAGSVAGTEPVAKANFLNYAETLVEPGAAVDAVGQVYEIQTAKLKSPISEKDKENLEGVYIYW
jgi:Head fiber protein.